MISRDFFFIRSQLVLPKKQNATFQKWETSLFVFGTPLARSIPNSRARLIEKGSLNGSTLIIVYYLSRLKLTFLVVAQSLNSQFSILATCLCWWNLLGFFFNIPITNSTKKNCAEPMAGKRKPKVASQAGCSHSCNQKRSVNQLFWNWSDSCDPVFSTEISQTWLP